MYLEYFGLKEKPFSLTPNTSFYCQLPSHDEAFKILQYSIENAEGIIKITGEVGTGKTLLCRKLLNSLPQHYVAAYIPNPALSATELYQAVAKELELDEIPSSRSILLDAIYQRLAALAEDGRRVVLIVDEAQAMPEDALEALRLMTNFETESDKLLQVVLFGQPELDVLLSQNNFRQLRQRITFSKRLATLTPGETRQYIEHRLTTAGYPRPSLFNRRALQLIAKASQGLPRVINVLCHKAMLVTYGKGGNVISVRAVQAAIADTQETIPGASKATKMPLFLLGSCVVLAAIIIVEIYRMRGA